MIEVELKFEIPSGTRSLLQEKLVAMPSVRWLGQIDNTDIYYDTANFDCLQQSVFIRMRNRTRLELKFHDHVDTAHTSCSERTFPMKPEPPQMQEINTLCSRFIQGWREASSVEEAIDVNCLVECGRIANQRTQFEHENLILCLDSVKGLGDFFEIEVACDEESEIKQALARLNGFVSALAFPAMRPVQTGYLEQWLTLHPKPISRLRKEAV